MSLHTAKFITTLQWRHNERDGVPNHRRLDYSLDHLFNRRSKKTSKLRVTGLCEGNQRRPVDSPHKGPVPRKMFPFDDAIMKTFITASRATYWVSVVGMWRLTKDNESSLIYSDYASDDGTYSSSFLQIGYSAHKRYFITCSSERPM